jgi:alpha-L-fucosidase 2
VTTLFFPRMIALVLGVVAGGCAAGGGHGGTAGQGGKGGQGETTGAAGTASAGTTGSAGTSGVAGSSGVAGVSGLAGETGAAGGASGGVAGGSGGGGGVGVAGAAGSAPPTTVVDGPMGQAFDTVKGALNVDHAAYFPKNDLVYNKPNTNPLYGLPVGNGRTGALVWSENGLTMQVSGVDLSQQSTYAGGLVSFNTTPALDAGGGAFQQRLALYDGELVTKYGSEAGKDLRTVTILGAANSEVIGIHVADTRAGVTSATVELSLWDLSTLQNFNAPSIDTWKKVATYAEAGSAGLSRGQTDANKFGYTMAATVEGAAFTTAANGPSGVRLSITPPPGGSYTIWIVCASRLNAAGNDSVAEAKAALARVTKAGFATTVAAYLDFWHSFWQRSFVQYSNAAGDADYLETAYYLATQMIAAGGFGNYPFHFINGV